MSTLGASLRVASTYYSIKCSQILHLGPVRAFLHTVHVVGSHSAIPLFMQDATHHPSWVCKASICGLSQLRFMLRHAVHKRRILPGLAVKHMAR
jgi:hypothetical protein